MQLVKNFFQSFIDAGQAWADDRVSLYAAAIAYFLVFSLAPILSLVIALAGRIFGQAAVRGRIVEQVAQFVGLEAAVLIEDIIESAMSGTTSTTIISVIILLFAASGVFNQLKRALDLIFGVIPRPQAGMKAAINSVRTRAISSLMVLFLGAILIAAMMLNTIIAVLDNYIVQYFPSVAELIPSLNTFAVPFVMFFLFAVLFKTLPHAIISWWDVIVGAIVTTVLVLIGNYLINIYLIFTSTASIYGAAGSLIVILIWIYYTAQIILYGAEYTKVFANRMGRRIVPAAGGMYLADRLLERNDMDTQQPPDEPEPVEPAPEPVPFGASFDAISETSPPPHQRRKQLASGLLGLALGLLLGFIANLRGDE